MFNYFRKTISVLRKTEGEYVNYKWEPGIEILIEIKASVQPLTPNEMQMMPEGRYTTQQFKLYTSFKLRTVDEQNPDVVLVDGERFEVISVAPWQSLSGFINHYKAIIAKVNKNAAL